MFEVHQPQFIRLIASHSQLKASAHRPFGEHPFVRRGCLHQHRLSPYRLNPLIHFQRPRKPARVGNNPTNFICTQNSKYCSPSAVPPPHSKSISVTFLATLFLLLFVSCAIVLRSYILRRRFQRHLDEAMAAGILLAPRSQGSRRRRFGSKPKLFDAWFSEGGDSWEEINVSIYFYALNLGPQQVIIKSTQSPLHFLPLFPSQPRV